MGKYLERGHDRGHACIKEREDDQVENGLARPFVFYPTEGMGRIEHEFLDLVKDRLPHGT
jgi:hypothetical protein